MWSTNSGLHALAAPWVRFRLRRDDREVFDLPPAAKAVDRVRQLLGNELARELIALPLTHGNGVSVEGFVLPASHARKGRRHQFVFLNGRPVEDAVISRALAEGFRGAVTDGMHPAAWLWIDLEPTLVDVNVHPAKREVRFHRPLDVRDAILEAVMEGLRPPAAQQLRDLRRNLLLTTPKSIMPAPRPVATGFRAPQPMLPKRLRWRRRFELWNFRKPRLPQGGGVPDFRILGMLRESIRGDGECGWPGVVRSQGGQGTDFL